MDRTTQLGLVAAHLINIGCTCQEVEIVIEPGCIPELEHCHIAHDTGCPVLTDPTQN